MRIQVEPHPYPHFVADGALSADIIHGMCRNWPGEGNFEAEIPGNYVCDLRRFMHEGFWKEFTELVLPKIVRPALGAFADWIELRYPGIEELSVSYYSLMQATGDYGGHQVHNHHYHDPTWVMTMLLYLDNDAEGHSGTTILKPVPTAKRDTAFIAAQTLNWQGYTEEHATVDYAQGRLFAFHDNAIAFHSVKPSDPGAIFGRRILRLHLSASADYVPMLYGVDHETYRSMRRNPTSDPTVLGWMRRDLEQLEVAHPSDPDDRSWIEQIRIAL